MLHGVEMLERPYERFNARDVESVLGSMHPDVISANGSADWRLAGFGLSSAGCDGIALQ